MLEYAAMNVGSNDSEGTAKALGKAIGDARRSKDLTQQDLCAAAGLSYSTLAKIERGAIKTPSVFTVQAIAQATDTTVEELVTGVAGVHSPAPKREYKTSKNGLKFVYFDVNGVLVHFFHKAFTEMAIRTGASAERIETTFWHYNDAVCRGEMPLSEFNQALASSIGSAPLDWQEYYMASIEPISEIQECLTWAAEHYKVGLISNIFPGFIDDMTKRGILPDIEYAAVVDSSVQGAIKPESQLYERATQMAGVSPHEILFIDDSRTNLMAAEHQGWNVLWFDDFRPAESVARIRNSLEF